MFGHSLVVAAALLAGSGLAAHLNTTNITSSQPAAIATHVISLASISPTGVAASNVSLPTRVPLPMNVSSHMSLNVSLPASPVHMNISLPKLQLNVSLPQVHLNVSLPKVHLNVSFPKVHMNVSLPKVHMNVSLPTSKLHLNVSLSRHEVLRVPFFINGGSDLFFNINGDVLAKFAANQINFYNSNVNIYVAKLCFDCALIVVLKDCQCFSDSKTSLIMRLPTPKTTSVTEMLHFEKPVVMDVTMHTGPVPRAHTSITTVTVAQECPTCEPLTVAVPLPVRMPLPMLGGHDCPDCSPEMHPTNMPSRTTESVTLITTTTTMVVMPCPGCDATTTVFVTALPAETTTTTIVGGHQTFLNNTHPAQSSVHPADDMESASASSPMITTMPPVVPAMASPSSMHPAHEMESHPAHEEMESHPAHEEMESHPTHEEMESHPAHEETESHPAHEETESHLAHEETESHPAHEEMESHPEHEEIEFHPGHEELESHPAHEEMESHLEHEEMESHPAHDETESHPASMEEHAPSSMGGEVSHVSSSQDMMMHPAGSVSQHMTMPSAGHDMSGSHVETSTMLTSTALSSHQAMVSPSAGHDESMSGNGSHPVASSSFATSVMTSAQETSMGAAASATPSMMQSSRAALYRPHKIFAILALGVMIFI